MKLTGNKIFSFMLAAAFALTLAGCGGGGGGTAATEPEPTPMPDPAIAERAAIDTAIGTASTRVNAVDNDSTDAEVSAADTAIANARNAIAAATNVPAEERAANTGTVDALANQLDGAKTARMDAMDAAEMAERMAMAVTAAKLYAGINAPAGDGTGNDDFHADYNAADTAIEVTIGAGDAPGTAVTLSEDKKTTVAANHGWQGQKFTASPDGGGTYEAYVYSNVGEPTEGAKFNDSANGGYTLNADDQIADVTSVTDYAGLVDSPSFDQSAGTKTFDLAENREYLEFAGTFNGVSGTYTCTPTAIATDRDTCGTTVAASGFTLVGGTWTFEPNDPEARLKNVPDPIYASYGWWIHKSEDGETFTASAFVSERGTVPDATGITALQGTATYTGGAAGKYALHSMTGGTNDAGHFTADATLEADFSDNMVTGTIDNFIGADGERRDGWSVELKESGVGDDGVIIGTDGTGTTQMQTVWTMDGTAADADGGWRGRLQDNDATSGVPKVGSGTFTAKFGADGNMVGAFGVNRQ